MNHGPLLKCTYPWECYHIRNTQLVMPQHKLLYMILSMGHKFKAHENRFWGGKESPRSRALLGEAEGCPGSENSGRVSSRAHGEGRDRGEGVSEREVRSPLDAETSLPTAQLPQMAHPRCNSLQRDFATPGGDSRHRDSGTLSSSYSFPSLWELQL